MVSVGWSDNKWGTGQRSKTEQKQEQLGARRRIKDKESIICFLSFEFEF